MIKYTDLQSATEALKNHISGVEGRKVVSTAMLSSFVQKHKHKLEDTRHLYIPSTPIEDGAEDVIGLANYFCNEISEYASAYKKQGGPNEMADVKDTKTKKDAVNDVTDALNAGAPSLADIANSSVPATKTKAEPKFKTSVKTETVTDIKRSSEDYALIESVVLQHTKKLANVTKQTKISRVVVRVKDPKEVYAGAQIKLKAFKDEDIAKYRELLLDTPENKKAFEDLVSAAAKNATIPAKINDKMTLKGIVVNYPNQDEEGQTQFVERALSKVGGHITEFLQSDVAFQITPDASKPSAPIAVKLADVVLKKTVKIERATSDLKEQTSKVVQVLKWEGVKDTIENNADIITPEYIKGVAPKGETAKKVNFSYEAHFEIMSFDKKGNPIIDKKTGKQKTRTIRARGEMLNPPYLEKNKKLEQSEDYSFAASSKSSVDPTAAAVKYLMNLEGDDLIKMTHGSLKEALLEAVSSRANREAANAAKSVSNAVDIFG